ncbi:MAG: hypothetical protein AB7O62_00270 [Pirellulales bacterium]
MRRKTWAEPAWILVGGLVAICVLQSCTRLGRAELVDVVMPREITRADRVGRAEGQAALAHTRRTDANAGAETPAPGPQSSPGGQPHEVYQCGSGRCRPFQRWQPLPQYSQPAQPAIRAAPATSYAQQASGDCRARCQADIQREIKALEERMEGRNAAADKLLAERIVALEQLAVKQDAELVKVEGVSDGHATLLGRLDGRINQAEEAISTAAAGVHDLLADRATIDKRIDGVQEAISPAARSIALEVIRQHAPAAATGLLPIALAGGLPAIGLMIAGWAVRSGIKAIGKGEGRKAEGERGPPPDAYRTGTSGLGGGSTVGSF